MPIKTVRCHALTLAAALLFTTSAVDAKTINVLWTAGTQVYNNNIANLASEAPSFDPASNGALTWALTMWDHTATPKPNFASYDVLVVGSTYGVDQDYFGLGFFGLGVSARGVLENKAEIAAARGTRTFLSGQDADWHDLNNLPNQDNGPKGFMINAVNWAASGTGLGIVSMTAGWGGSFGPGIAGWWDHADSFLRTEVLGKFTFVDREKVLIGAGQDSFPINEGLTSDGLSNWSTSSHALFDVPLPGYTAINFDPFGKAVTLVTAGREGGGTGGGDDDTPPVPLPAAAWLMLGALGLLGAAARRRRPV